MAEAEAWHLLGHSGLPRAGGTPSYPAVGVVGPPGLSSTAHQSRPDDPCTRVTYRKVGARTQAVGSVGFSLRANQSMHVATVAAAASNSAAWVTGP